MPDSKITALTALTSADPANDMFPIVDVSDTSMAASGTTKRISINNLLAASGTATLASATITGDLTVDTSTLKVDSTNNRVGINTATPVAGIALHVCDNVFGANLSSGVRFGNSGNNYYFDQLIVTDGSANPSYQLKFTNQTLSRYLFGGGANYWEWYANNTLGMTLNSTGLGVGVASPSAKLHISGNLKIDGATSEIFMATGAERTISASGSSGATALTFKRWDGVSAYVSDVIFNGSGNVGIGVTPSAWVSTFKAINVSSYAAFGGNSDDKLTLVGNNYYNDGTAKFVGNGYAGAYSIYQGAHRFQISTTNNSSGAGAALTFTQAMTLDASGRLILLASTTTPATLATNGELTFTATSNTNLRFSYRGSDGVTRTADLTLA